MLPHPIVSRFLSSWHMLHCSHRITFPKIRTFQLSETKSLSMYREKIFYFRSSPPIFSREIVAKRLPFSSSFKEFAQSALEQMVALKSWSRVVVGSEFGIFSHCSYPLRLQKPCLKHQMLKTVEMMLDMLLLSAKLTSLRNSWMNQIHFLPRYRMQWREKEWRETTLQHPIRMRKRMIMRNGSWPWKMNRLLRPEQTRSWWNATWSIENWWKNSEKVRANDNQVQSLCEVDVDACYFVLFQILEKWLRYMSAWCILLIAGDGPLLLLADQCKIIFPVAKTLSKRVFCDFQIWFCSRPYIDWCSSRQVQITENACIG